MKSFKKFFFESVEENLDEEHPTWMVHVDKPVNKLKQGKTVMVKARNNAEAIRKGAIKHGDESARHGDFLRAEKIKEEVEQIDEISQEKLRDYHAAAGADRQKAKGEVEKIFKDKKPTPEKVQKTADAYKRFIKRGKGMTAAANKMSEEVELDELKKSTLGSYVKKASSDMASNAYNLGARDPLKKPGSWDKAFKRKAGIEKATDRLAKEEVEQLDELSPNTLHSYIKKSAGNMAGNAAVAAAQASSSMKKSSPDVKRNIKNRMKGITSASGRLADKANMAEEAELDEASDLRITKVYNKFPKKATYAVHSPDRKYFKEFDNEADAKKHLETKK